MRISDTYSTVLVQRECMSERLRDMIVAGEGKDFGEDSADGGDGIEDTNELDRYCPRECSFVRRAMGSS